MKFFRRKQKYSSFDPQKPSFVVFEKFIDDKEFKGKAQKRTGCTIKSNNGDYSITACTGDGYESFCYCYKALKYAFDKLLERKKIDLNLLCDESMWGISVFIRIK